MNGRANSSIKLLVILRGFDPGGAERQLLEFLRGADRSRLRITVACFYRGVWHDEAAGIPGIEVIDLKKAGRYDGPNFFLNAWRVARRIRPDVIYGYSGAADVISLVLGKMLGCKVVWGIRSSNMNLAPYGMLSRILFRLSCSTAKYVDAIVANSEAGATYYTRMGFPVERMVVIPNGVHTDRFTRSEHEGALLRRQLRIPLDAMLITLVGRLDPVKNHTVFLRAISMLPSNGCNFRFLCVGRGELDYAAELLQIARKLRIDHLVTMTGHIEDMKAVYSATDICVLPSSSEGFPNTIVEAMACEVPCVATDVGDCRQIMGDIGRIIPVGDASALAEAIHTLSKDDLRLIGQRGRKRVQELFAVNKMADRTATVFESVVLPGTI